MERSRGRSFSAPSSQSCGFGLLFCNFHLGLNRDSTVLSDCCVELHFSDSYGMVYGCGRESPRSRCIATSGAHSKLVVMVVIGSRVANYIKLVAKRQISCSGTYRNMSCPMISDFDTISWSTEVALASGVGGVRIVDFDRVGEGFGFGGTLSETEEAVALFT